MVSILSFLMLSILQVFWGMSRANRGDFPRQVVPLHLEDVAVVLRDVDLVRGFGLRAWPRVAPDLQHVRLGAVTMTESGDDGAVDVFFFHTLHISDFRGPYKGKADLYFRS